MLIVLTSKDAAGKRLDVDFDGKEYLLQDAERKYWTIKLSVQRVKEEELEVKSTGGDTTAAVSQISLRQV